MKYKIVTDEGFDSLDETPAINHWLSKGWQLYGSPFGVYNKEYGITTVYQAMTMEEE